MPSEGLWTEATWDC